MISRTLPHVPVTPLYQNPCPGPMLGPKHAPQGKGSSSFRACPLGTPPSLPSYLVLLLWSFEDPQGLPCSVNPSRQPASAKSPSEQTGIQTLQHNPLSFIHCLPDKFLPAPLGLQLATHSEPGVPGGVGSRRSGLSRA